MRRSILAVLGVGVLFFSASALITPSAPPEELDKEKTTAPLSPSTFTVPGQTQCMLQRRGILAPAVLHPVTMVLVSVGDKVKKDQRLVQIDDDEPQADVRVKKANLENAGIAMREAKRYLASLEKLQAQGAIAEQRIHDVRATALKAEAEERAAKAAVDLAMAELEHYVVSAPIDGVVNKLSVHPGMVSRPGTTIWGEILDLSEMEVRCQLDVDQVDLFKIGDTVDVLDKNAVKSYGIGRLVFIGLEANREDGKIPVLVRLANLDGKLRCEIPVKVRFTQAPTIQ